MAKINGILVALPGAICGALLVGHLINNDIKETIIEEIDNKSNTYNILDSLQLDAKCKKAYFDSIQISRDSVTNEQNAK